MSLQRSTSMDWGMANRMARIFDPTDGRTMMLAVDHGYFLGPTRNLESPARTITPLAPYADALMLTRGVLRRAVEPSLQASVVLRVSGGSSVVGADLSNERITTSIDEAVRLNVSAVALSVFVGAAYEHQTLTGLAALVDQARPLGIPVLAVTAVGKELEKRDSRYLALACRISAELGADIVKTYYCEHFEDVIEATPVPVVIAGGPRLETERDALQLARDALDRGAAGVDMGRNIWQSPAPVAMMRAIRGVVHDSLKVDEAHDLYAEIRSSSD